MKKLTQWIVLSALAGVCTPAAFANSSALRGPVNYAAPEVSSIRAAVSYAPAAVNTDTASISRDYRAPSVLMPARKPSPVGVPAHSGEVLIGAVRGARTPL